jgi:hypothetical protein
MTRQYALDGSALDHALDLMSRGAPEQTGRARAALEVLLQGVRTSCWPEVAWAFSELTPNGFPIELTFSTIAGHTIRYVVEIAGPETPEQQRLGEAFRLYRQLAGRAASREVERAMLEMQSGHELFYGAWFGGAHGPTADRYKIYAEVPKGAYLGKFLPGVCTGFGPLPHCPTRPVMLGLQPETDVREIYFRAANLAPQDIGRLLWSNQLGHRYCETLELIDCTAGRPGATAALEGFSLAFECDRVRAVSLFADSKVLFGSDANVRRTLLQLARSRNWALEGYEQVTQMLQYCYDRVRHQGVIAWIISNEGSIEVRIGLTP